MEDLIKAIISDILGVRTEQLTNEARIVEDLGADSLDCIELTIALEEQFTISIPDADIRSPQTVGGIINCIANKIQVDGGG